MSRRILIVQSCLLLVAALVAAAVSAQAAQESQASPPVELLWPGGAPGAVGNEDVDKPSLTIFLPEGVRATGVGVVVCPGGGYAVLAMDYEGTQIAEWLNSFGIAAFVLKYRLGPRYHHPAPMLDAQRAVRTVRANAGKFHLNPHDIGIWGFSAGGHLASTVATHFDSGDPQAADPLDRVSCRPDFAILAYPVISFTTEYTHRGSLENLLGKNPDPRLVEYLSTEKQVTPETPPTFLFHTDADRGVPAENSVLFYLALRRAGVPAELHIFQHGPHGVGLAPTDQVLAEWGDCLANWLKARSCEWPPR
jgi:acetyl esterase/lipase